MPEEPLNGLSRGNDDWALRKLIKEMVKIENTPKIVKQIVSY